MLWILAILIVIILISTGTAIYLSIWMIKKMKEEDDKLKEQVKKLRMRE